MSFAAVAARQLDNPAPEATSITVTKPSGLATGDLWIIAVVRRGNDAAFTWPAGFTELAALADVTGGKTRLEVRSRVCDGSETNITVSLVINSQWKAMGWRITGYAGTPVATIATGDSTNANPPNLGPSWGAADTLWLAVMGIDGFPTISAAPANYGQFNQNSFVGTTSWCRIATGERELNAASENPGTFTSDTEQWVAATIAIQPSGVTGLGAAAALETGLAHQASVRTLLTVADGVAAPTAPEQAAAAITGLSQLQLEELPLSVVETAALVIAAPTFASVLTRQLDNPPEATTTIEVTKPAGLAAGDLWVIAVTRRGQTSAFTWPVGFTAITSAQDVTSGLIRLEVRARICDGSETNITVTNANGSSQWKAYSWRVRGYVGLPEGAAVTGDSTNANPPNLIPSWGDADTVWLAVAAWDGFPAISAWPTNYTNTFQNGFVGTTSWTRLAGGERALHGSAENPGSFTSDPEQWCAATIAIRPSADLLATMTSTDPLALQLGDERQVLAVLGEVGVRRLSLAGVV